MSIARPTFFDFNIHAIGMNAANERLINSFSGRDTTIIHKAVNRTDKLKRTRTVHGFLVYCEGFKEPFYGRTPGRAVDKLMSAVGITTVQQYINNMEATL